MDREAHIVVVGGGAGGLELAIRLAKQRGPSRHRVTLIDRNPSHLWKPRLHEIAAGLLVPADEELSFAEQASEHGFTFVLGELNTIDPEQKVIVVGPVQAPDARIGLAGGALLPQREFSYDLAVLAIGSTINDFGTPGVREHCYTLDSPAGANQLHEALRALAARVADGRCHRIRIVIVGAGTTGVELAAELRSVAQHQPEFVSLITPDQMHVAIVEMAERPLPAGAAATSDYARHMLSGSDVEMHFGAKVTRVDPGRVELADGSSLRADAVVWASGIRGPDIVQSIPGLAVERGNRIRVNEDLNAVGLDGLPVDGLFCIGDCAACYEPGASAPTPATAQAAHQQAKLLAASLRGFLQNRPLLAFRYRYRGTLVSLGASRAVGDVPLTGDNSLRISGVGAKVAYNARHQSHLAVCVGWWRTAMLAMAGLLRRQAGPKVKLRW